MFEPVRGGTRGGQAEFKWSDVSQDKDREHYLGHSINAPTGRWQKNKDVHWYNRDVNQTDAEKAAEIKRIKEAEAEAMAQVLGFAPAKKSLDVTTGGGNGPDGSPPPGASTSLSPPNEEEPSKGKIERRMRKLEKRAKKAEKKARKEAKSLQRHRADSGSDYERDDRYRHESDRRRSRSPRRSYSREGIRNSYRRRSASPRRNRRSASPLDPKARYDRLEQERERERDRRRWDVNAMGDLPRGRRAR